MAPTRSARRRSCVIPRDWRRNWRVTGSTSTRSVPAQSGTGLQQRATDAEQARNPELAELDPLDAFYRKVPPRDPDGRPQTAEEIGKMAEFLASDDAQNVTGQCLHVDGGAILRD